MSNDITKLSEERISLEAKIFDMKKLARDTSADFNSEKWNQLQGEYEECINKINTANQSLRQDALSYEPSQPQPFVEAPTNPITKQVDGFDQMDKKGYECAGELMADHIAMLIPSLSNQMSDYRTKRYSHYVQSTNALSVEQAAGNASTLIDGVEIIPDLQPGVKEYGAGSGREVLSMFNPLPTNRKEVDYYINEDTYNVDGLTVSRVSEGGQLSPQNFNNKLERFRLYKTGVFAAITEEDIQNVPMLEAKYFKRAPEVLAIQKVQDIISGDGIAKPLGFTNPSNGALIGINRDTTSQIKYADLCNMEGRLKRDAMGAWFYMANENAIPQLCQLTDGSGARIWTANRNDGILNPIFHGTLNGRPLLISEDAPLMATDSGLMLVNTAGYTFGEHTSGVRVAESMHFYFDTDKRAIRWLSQYGGRPVFNSAYQPRTAGAPTLSHFVSLNAAT